MVVGVVPGPEITLPIIGDRNDAERFGCLAKLVGGRRVFEKTIERVAQPSLVIRAQHVGPDTLGGGLVETEDVAGFFDDSAWHDYIDATRCCSLETWADHAGDVVASALCRNALGAQRLDDHISFET